METRPHSSASPLVHFEINAGRCDLRVGDEVMPDTEIGMDSATGRSVTAGCRGEVVAIRFSGGSHTLLVTVRRSP